MSLALLDAIFANVYIIAVAFGLLMIGAAAINNKKQTYYSREDTPDMRKHRLNTVYHFNEKKRLNYEDINRTYYKMHVMVAVTATLIMLMCAGFGITDNLALGIGFVAYFVLTIVGTKYTLEQIAEKYKNTK